MPTIIFGDSPVVGGISYDVYITLSDADIYFQNKLKNEAWNDATDAEKTAALIESTRRIDSLRYIGSKTDLLQSLEFPRYPSIVIPSDIKIACLELAYVLLDDIDADMEIENLAVTSDKYSSVSTSYNRSFTLEHIQAGIPSIFAWQHLLPYLVNPLNLTLRRS